MKKYVSETNYFSALTTEEFESKFIEAAGKIEGVRISCSGGTG